MSGVTISIISWGEHGIIKLGHTSGLGAHPAVHINNIVADIIHNRPGPGGVRCVVIHKPSVMNNTFI